MSLKTSSQPSTTHDQDTFLVEFEDGDPRNPVNFSTAKKWGITITACGFTGIAAAATSTYTMGVPGMVDELHCSTFAATVGFSVYPIGFAVVPLFTSSLSEEFGRFRLYILTTFLFMLMHVIMALQTVVFARFLSGSFGSTGATLVGGTIADIWKPDKRGFPMALFAISALGSSGLGPLLAGWVAFNDDLGWRWIQWISAIVGGICFLSVLVLLTETRVDIILTRLARKMTQMKQDDRYHTTAEIDKHSLLTLIKITSTRPISLLLTEPIVLSFSVRLFFLCSISGEMESIYDFTIGERGSTYICITLGSILGWIANMYQEVLYRKYVTKKGPEARLCLALVAAILLPAGMLIYAWTARPSIHWIAPLVGLTVFMIGAFVIYQAIFVYLADCYGPYASSALAGQSMCRNLLAAIFPLFTDQMYDNLTYNLGMCHARHPKLTIQ
ncbi:major facilitator superfamily domain-containing protein [Boletus coccyginus]|nr:major facilitator superfamily domain-containing protein [Boletus coccyginus]